MEELGSIQEQNNGAGTQTLSEMPSFAEHMAEIQEREKTFEEARSEGNLPEGIRDEQDYKEYLAEQKARRSETVERDHALFSEIESIEDPYNKSFMTAALGLSYRNGSHNTIVPFCMDFIQQEEFLDIGDFLKSKRTEFSDTDALTISRSADTLSRLKTGATIDKEADTLSGENSEFDQAWKNFWNHESRFFGASGIGPRLFYRNETSGGEFLGHEIPTEKRTNTEGGITKYLIKKELASFDKENLSDGKAKTRLKVLSRLYEGRSLEGQLGSVMEFIEEQYEDQEDESISHNTTQAAKQIRFFVSVQEVANKIRDLKDDYSDYSRFKSLGSEILEQRNN